MSLLRFGTFDVTHDLILAGLSIKVLLKKHYMKRYILTFEWQKMGYA